jgi:hypothetical protein
MGQGAVRLHMKHPHLLPGPRAKDVDVVLGQDMLSAERHAQALSIS